MKAYGSKRILGSAPNGMPKTGALRKYGGAHCTCRPCRISRQFAKTAGRMAAALAAKKEAV